MRVESEETAHPQILMKPLSCSFPFPFVLDGVYFQKRLCDPTPCSSGSPPCAPFSGRRGEPGLSRPSSDPVPEGLRLASGRGLHPRFLPPASGGTGTARFTAHPGQGRKTRCRWPRWRPAACATCWVSGENSTRSANFVLLLVLSAGFSPVSLYPSSLESAMLSPATQMGQRGSDGPGAPPGPFAASPRPAWRCGDPRFWPVFPLTQLNSAPPPGAGARALAGEGRRRSPVVSWVPRLPACLLGSSLL